MTFDNIKWSGNYEFFKLNLDFILDQGVIWILKIRLTELGVILGGPVATQQVKCSLRETGSNELGNEN